MKKLKNIYPVNLLTIDPGVNTGLCYWDGGRNHHVYSFKESSVYKDYAKLDRISILTDTLRTVILGSGMGIQYAIIEDVELWSGNLTSMTAAKKGDTFMLAQLVMGYAFVLRNMGVSVKLAMPREWRGQLPEAALQRRILEVFPDFDVKENLHVTDAVGIGLGAVGLIDHRINLLKDWMY